VNTSLHGVGHFFVERAFEAFGFQPFIPVVAQVGAIFSVNMKFQ
jgi:hypothetical protein